MIKGVGIDIIEIDRIKRIVEKNRRFLERIFNTEEENYIISRKYNIHSISGMFAAKEAVSKVLGTGIGKIKWQDIEISHDSYGKPIINLSGNARLIAVEKEINHIYISISHIDKYAIALAIGENMINNILIDKEKIKDLKEKNKGCIIDYECVKRILPSREKNSHKGTYGKVGVVAGSLGMTGASYLTSMSALRSGSGLVYTFIPKSLNTIVEVKATEVITKPIEDYGKGFFSSEFIKDIIEFSHNLDVLAVGPGLGVNCDTITLVEEILKSIDKPIVLDADGINCIQHNPTILEKRTAPTIITPHPGELSRLLNVKVEQIQSDRKKYSMLTSKKFSVITVLKGYNTVISDFYGNTYINSTGNPGMATAGSGDVLTGIITGFVGQGINPLDSSIAGVYIHGIAGDIVSKEKGEYGLIASDILDNIPYAIKAITGK